MRQLIHRVEYSSDDLNGLEIIDNDNDNQNLDGKKFIILLFLIFIKFLIHFRRHGAADRS